MENIRWIKNSILRRMDMIIDWMQYYALNLVLAAMVFGMLIMLALMAAAILWEPAEAKLHPWMQEQVAREADLEWQAEQSRLHRKHGTGHVIIYSPEGAYYHNARGEKAGLCEITQRRIGIQPGLIRPVMAVRFRTLQPNRNGPRSGERGKINNAD